jgi:tetratricopeptide (TPR) repeat protein
MRHQKDDSPFPSGYPEAFVVRSYDIPSAYASINSAVNSAIPGIVITVFPGIYSLSSNVLLQSEITLIIKSGATVNLNGYSITVTNGTIIVENGATINGRKATLSRNSMVNNNLYGTVQAAVNTITDNDYGNTYDLALASGSISENISLSNKYGVHLYGSGSTVLNGSLSLTNCESCTFNTFTANTISLSGCTVPQLTGINLNIGSGNQCLYAYNSTNLYYSAGTVWDRYAYTNGTGLNIYQSSTSAINENSGTTYIYGNVRGVVATGSTVNINNAHFCSNTYDLVSSSGAAISANNCWFPGAIASTQGSGITLFGNQDFSGCGMPKSSFKSAGNIIADVDSLKNEFMQINNKNFDLAKRVREDISANKVFDKEKFLNDYQDIAGSYNDFINKHPESDYSKTALTSIVQNYKLLNDYEGMSNYLQAVISDNNLKNVSGLAKRFLMDYYSHQKDFTTALKTADEILTALKNKSGDENLTCNVLYAKGLIYAHDLNESKEAITCFSDIINNHQDNTLADFAKNELQLLGVDAEKIAVKNTDVNNSSDISTSNYPNPFNPSTIISYQLPKDGFVTLKVYDVLGREVKTLVNEYKIQGKYEITFNGTGLASGVYYYQLRVADPSGKVNNSVVTKKILLMK